MVNGKFSDQEYLQLIFDFTIKNADELSKTYSKLNMHESRGKQKHIHDLDADVLYQYMIDLSGYNAFPQVYPSGDYKNLCGPELYRGVTDKEHAANFLADFNYHYGTGTQNNGTYFSDRKVCAKPYTQPAMVIEEDCEDVEDKIFTIKMAPTTRFVDDDFINHDVGAAILLRDTSQVKSIVGRDKRRLDALINFVDTISDADQVEKFLFYLQQDSSKMAIYLGYDGLIQTFKYMHYVVLNRGKIIVSQKEYDRVCNQSKNYKGGFINFAEDGRM
jgi:hypothetical protein